MVATVASQVRPALARQLEALGEEVAAARQVGAPIIVHAASNNGTILLCRLLQQKLLAAGEVAAVAFDCAAEVRCSDALMVPVYRGVLAAALKRHPRFKGNMAEVSKVVNANGTHVEAFVRACSSRFIDWGDAIEHVARELRQAGVPILFLMSENDRLITPEKVREFIELCGGGTVVELGAAHVMLLRHQPERYAAAVHAHLESALAASKEAARVRIVNLIDVLQDDHPDVPEPPEEACDAPWSEASVRAWFASGGIAKT